MSGFLSWQDCAFFPALDYSPSRKKNFPESHIIHSLLAKLVRSRWPDTGLILGQYPVILTSRFLNKPVRQWLQPLSFDSYIYSSSNSIFFSSIHSFILTNSTFYFSVQSSTDVNYTTPQQLKQFFIIVPSKLRLVTLAAFLLWKNRSEVRIYFAWLVTLCCVHVS